mmetsp:Transcript_3901/g.6111  ORF Transcript_3901/g.6111 Transcript_3901/m.6111 type:complete len:541 (-) Transcript_3901:82-1704(-)
MPLLSHFCVYRKRKGLSSISSSKVFVSFGTAENIPLQSDKRAVNIYEFSVPRALQREALQGFEIAALIKFSIELAVNLYQATFSTKTKITTVDVVRESDVHTMVASFLERAVHIKTNSRGPHVLTHESNRNMISMQSSYTYVYSFDSGRLSMWSGMNNHFSMQMSTAIPVSCDAIVSLDRRLLDWELGEKHLWMFPYYVDLVQDIFRALPAPSLQSVPESFESLPQHMSVRGDMLLAGLRCDEGPASEVTAAYVAASDLLPSNQSTDFSKYVTASMIGNITSSDAKLHAVPPSANEYLLCSRTRKRARLASLLAESEQASIRKEVHPSFSSSNTLLESAALSRRCQMYCDRIREDGSFAHRVSSLFEDESSADVAPPSHAHAASPTRDMVECISAMAEQKCTKRRRLTGRVMPSAIIAVAVVVEELACELVSGWLGRGNPLQYCCSELKKEAALQLQGADASNVECLQSVLQNRLQVLFGVDLSPCDRELVTEVILSEQQRRARTKVSESVSLAQIKSQFRRKREFKRTVDTSNGGIDHN